MSRQVHIKTSTKLGAKNFSIALRLMAKTLPINRKQKSEMVSGYTIELPALYEPTRLGRQTLIRLVQFWS